MMTGVTRLKRLASPARVQAASRVRTLLQIRSDILGLIERLLCEPEAPFEFAMTRVEGETISIRLVRLTKPD